MLFVIFIHERFNFLPATFSNFNHELVKGSFYAARCADTQQNYFLIPEKLVSLFVTSFQAFVTLWAGKLHSTVTNHTILISSALARPLRTSFSYLYVSRCWVTAWLLCRYMLPCTYTQKLTHQTVSRFALICWKYLQIFSFAIHRLYDVREKRRFGVCLESTSLIHMSEFKAPFLHFIKSRTLHKWLLDLRLKVWWLPWRFRDFVYFEMQQLGKKKSHERSCHHHHTQSPSLRKHLCGKYIENHLKIIVKVVIPSRSLNPLTHSLTHSAARIGSLLRKRKKAKN